TAALARCLTPLKFLGVPTEDVAMILGVAIQFIPTLLTESDMIRKAQTARGAEFESVRLRDRLCCATQLVVPIFLAAFRRADELAMAMEARGYHCQSIGKKVAEKAK
ncbi:MAG: energy-coupling factor transporter transmembrane component T, partial [Oscillospiraceae bacterium]